MDPDGSTASKLDDMDAFCGGAGARMQVVVEREAGTDPFPPGSEYQILCEVDDEPC